MSIKDEQDDAAERPLPRGASPAELDRLRASIRVHPRAQPSVPPKPADPAGAAALKTEIDRLIEEGRALLEAQPQAAHEAFERAYRKSTTDTRVLSNYGLTLVLVEGDRQRGIRFCEEAVRRGQTTSEALINLAKALVQTRNKEQAVRALRRAMELAPDDPRVSHEFVLLGLRRKTPIPWLPRSFFLNKWIGQLTWWLSHRHEVNFGRH